MENKINQYLDKEDGMYHITFYKFISSVLVRNILNYRLYSIELTDGTIIRDPEFVNSKYVFKIHTDFLNKNIFFNARFSIDDIKNIKKFKFGLCDEKVIWYEDHFIDIKNELSFVQIINEKPPEDISSNFRKVENNEQEDCEIIDLAVKPGELASINIDDPKPIVEFLSLEYIFIDFIHKLLKMLLISIPNKSISYFLIF